MKILTLTALKHFQYAVGCTFAEQLHQGFAQLGHECAIYDLSPEKAQNALPALLKKFSPDLVVSMSASAMTLKLGDNFVFQGIPFIGILIDHPAQTPTHFSELPNKTVLTLVEPSQQSFIEAFSDKSTQCHFLPHAASIFANSVQSTEKYQIVFCGSGAEAQTVISWAKNSLPPELGEAFLNLCEQVLASGDFDYCKHFSVFQDIMQASFLTLLINKCDMLVRRHLRYHYLHVLDKAGIAVDIFGNYWPQGCFKNHRMHDAISHEEALRIMDSSQLSLCISDTKPFGSHERVLDEMLRGNICLTTRSSFWQENFSEGEDYFAFNYNDDEDLIKSVQRALKYDKTEEQKEMTAQKVRDKHLWVHRAQTIIEDIYPKLKPN
ncbi:MAG: glycosyltransferase family 1 protein [Lentisphaeraceae bacterium]|nr:glycosyltransferase family 1 protein [Lentisphaeraceae bacterium]